MSAESMLAAKYCDAALSPMGRLTLLMIADCYLNNDVAAFRLDDTRIAELAHATRQPEALVVDALLELSDLGVLVIDTTMSDAFPERPHTPNVWAAFLGDWEQSWAGDVFALYPCVRQPVPRELRDAVMERDDHTCQNCGTHQNLSIDHIIPVYFGGMTVAANLQVLCRSCNARKGVKLP